KLVRVAADGGRDAGAEVTIVDLRDFPMPLYDGDLEANEGLPEPVKRLKALFMEHQGLLISSPEYNGGMSAVLKNTIDWVSRSAEGEGGLAAYKDKVAGLVAASPGRLGGLRGLAHLRQILSNIGVLVLPQQHALGGAGEAFDDQGGLKDSTQLAAVSGIGARLVRTIDSLAR
ncbi:MAG: NAD(P)H-dependent oxidoreductase, partial [Alphaproteobacteria bacterium]|nr:NAD(P)H-dependent oxidoreductase [Alphaproteobacteria bacterium]